jgi:hypothetical protein
MYQAHATVLQLSTYAISLNDPEMNNPLYCFPSPNADTPNLGTFFKTLYTMQEMVANPISQKDLAIGNYKTLGEGDISIISALMPLVESPNVDCESLIKNIVHQVTAPMSLLEKATSVLEKLKIKSEDLEKTENADLHSECSKVIKSMHDFIAQVPVKVSNVDRPTFASVQKEAIINMMSNPKNCELLAKYLTHYEKSAPTQMSPQICIQPSLIREISASHAPQSILFDVPSRPVIQTVKSVQKKPEDIKHKPQDLSDLKVWPICDASTDPSLLDLKGILNLLCEDYQEVLYQQSDYNNTPEKCKSFNPHLLKIKCKIVSNLKKIYPTQTVKLSESFQVKTADNKMLEKIIKNNFPICVNMRNTIEDDECNMPMHPILIVVEYLNKLNKGHCVQYIEILNSGYSNVWDCRIYQGKTTVLPASWDFVEIMFPTSNGRYCKTQVTFTWPTVSQFRNQNIQLHGLFGFAITNKKSLSILDQTPFTIDNDATDNKKRYKVVGWSTISDIIISHSFNFDKSVYEITGVEDKDHVKTVMIDGFVFN